ncbi:MAG: hypothetical protein ABL867_05750, partial [Rickettsiales bacterium]
FSDGYYTDLQKHYNASEQDIYNSFYVARFVLFSMLMCFLYLAYKGYKFIRLIKPRMVAMVSEIAKVEDGNAKEWYGGNTLGSIIMLRLMDGTPIFISHTRSAKWGTEPVVTSISNAIEEITPYIKANQKKQQSKQGVSMTIGDTTVTVDPL